MTCFAKKNLNQRSLTPRWPLTPHLLTSHVWLYPKIIVSKSHENTSKYVDTVNLFAKTWTKGHWPLDDLWPHICWGHMCDSTQGSLCLSPMGIRQCMWIQWSILQITTYIHVHILHTTYYVQNQWSHHTPDTLGTLPDIAAKARLLRAWLKCRTITTHARESVVDLSRNCKGFHARESVHARVTESRAQGTGVGRNIRQSPSRVRSVFLLIYGSHSLFLNYVQARQKVPDFTTVWLGVCSVRCVSSLNPPSSSLHHDIHLFQLL